MEADPRLPLDLRLMAESVNLSVPHLCHLFKKETGLTAARSVKLAKMKHSADLLTHTFITIKEIVVISGFRDESHFVRDFKKTYGVTPTEYRKRHFKNGNGAPNTVSVQRAVATGPIKSKESRAKSQAAVANSKSDEPKSKERGVTAQRPKKQRSKRRS